AGASRQTEFQARSPVSAATFCFTFHSSLGDLDRNTVSLACTLLDHIHSLSPRKHVFWAWNPSREPSRAMDTARRLDTASVSALLHADNDAAAGLADCAAVHSR